MIIQRSRERGFAGVVDVSGNTVPGDIDTCPTFYPDGIYPTYKIVEATVASEYAALSDANKDLYKIILSCGVVDLSTGTAVRNYLMSMFGAGTTTRANLVTLVS